MISVFIDPAPSPLRFSKKNARKSNDLRAS
jgi:hypothetical protein